MKQGKRPTRKQKELMSSYKLHPDNWLVVSDTHEGLLLLNRAKGTTRLVRKEA